MKKYLSKIFLCILVSAMCCCCLVACGTDDDDEPSPPSHDSTKWFTETELASVGLSGMTAPSGLVGEMYSNDFWYCDGLLFRQSCSDADTFETNAQVYFDYFKTHYDGLFGTASPFGYGTKENKTWYKITQKKNLSDYFDDNPSKLYKFYYVTDDTLEDGFYKTSAVWSLEIRYEFDTESNGYFFKLYIENAGTSHNGVFTNYYVMQ